MVVHDFNVISMPVFKSKTQPPRPVDDHRPLGLSIARQLMQTNRFQRSQIVERAAFCSITNRIFALSASKPENFDFPLSMNCRVALLAIDLIIHQTYYASRCMSTGQRPPLFLRPLRRPLAENRINPLFRIGLQHILHHHPRGVIIGLGDAHFRLLVKRPLADPQCLW